MIKSSSFLATGFLGIVLLTGCDRAAQQAKPLLAKEPAQAQIAQTAQSEPKLRGIPLSCFLRVPPLGVYPHQAFNTYDTVSNESRQWAEIALAYAKAGQFEKAIELTEKLDDSMTYSQQETLIEIAGLLSAAGQYDKALQLVERIKYEERYKAELVARVARQYAAAGDRQQAERTFSRALQLAKTFGELQGTAALVEIATEYAAASQFDRAAQLAGTIKDENNKPLALAQIAGEYARSGQFDAAVRLANSIKDDYYKGTALAGIGKHATVAQLDRLVGETNRIKDEIHQVAARAAIASRYVALGEFDRAVRLAKTLAAHDDLLSPLAGEYAAAGRFDLAVELANSIKNEYWKQPALLKIAEEYVAAGKYTEALEFAGALQSKEVKIRALRAMAQKDAEAGEYARALQRYREALEVAKTIQPPPEYPPEAIYGIEEYSIPLIKCSLGQG
ncbi:MAG: hypothetical protein KME26_20740 [Oscillatoria princeps RMCB-10]|jgi:tetratricopeptide (TPR) repeat protein|nr:hypothetical protein [Oscillatoria princeps RMCB-10]